MILIVDNYDSFVHNLARYVRQLCNPKQQISVARNDSSELESLDEENVEAIILSPGPCGPKLAGRSLEIVKRFHTTTPILGVCLGHQVIVESFGGTISQSPQPTHGKHSLVFHDQNTSLFHDIPSPFQAGRYHSLIANNNSMPTELKVIAKLKNSTIMAIQHCDYPTFGVQFHPESVLTEHGYPFLFNFLNIAGIECTLPEFRAV